MKWNYLFLGTMMSLMTPCLASEVQVPVQTDPLIVQSLAQVNADSIFSYIQALVNCHTRHNLSSQTDAKKGIGAATAYLENKCHEFVAKASKDRIKPVVEVVRYEAGGEKTRIGKKISLPNVMVTLPGSVATGEVILLAHYDTRVNDNYDGETFAPGANDNGSGCACLLEIVRILSRVTLNQTVRCIFTSGEEHGLWGATHMAKQAKEKGWPVLAVLNNDMIGNTEASETGLKSNTIVRVFSDSPKGEDSDARQLARYIQEMAGTYVPGHEVKLIYRNDRYRRGGDHSPFLQEGYPAIRISEYYENYDRTHQVVREENGIKYGDVLEEVDVEYVKRNTQVNMATVLNLAFAPAEPSKASIANANALSNYTVLEYSPVLKADGSVDTSVSYEVLYRETDQPVWMSYKVCAPATSSEKQRVSLPISKDNYFYAIRSVSAAGHCSLPRICR